MVASPTKHLTLCKKQYVRNDTFTMWQDITESAEKPKSMTNFPLSLVSIIVASYYQRL